MPVKGYRKNAPVDLEAARHEIETPSADPETFKLYFLAGDSHVCGRVHPHVRFQPDEFGSDHRPHAYVRRGVGDWLIEAEGDDRYEWSREAIAAFNEE